MGNMTTDIRRRPALEVVVAFVILKIVEIRSQDTLRFLSQPPCRSVLRRLRALKLHPSTGVSSQDPINVLPYLERLEVLEAHSFHLPIYSMTPNYRLFGH